MSFHFFVVVVAVFGLSILLVLWLAFYYDQI
jgi:hypothetical protein